MTGRLRDLTINRDDSQNVTVTVYSDFAKTFDKLKDAEVNVEIKKASKGRSLTANNFLWALCSDIGKALKPPLSKDDVYRMAIKAVGVYWQTTIPVFHVETVRTRWESHGDGWVFDVVDDDEPGRKLCHLYFGTSTYTVSEMRVILDWLVDQCMQMEIPIPISKREEEEMLERWGSKLAQS